MTTSGLDYPTYSWGGPAGMPEGWREKLEALWPNGDRLTLAMRLSPTREVCVDLLRGYHVDPARLDQDWLKWAKREQYVALRPALETL